MRIIATELAVSNNFICCQRPNPAPGACYSGSVTDPNLETLVDRNWTRRRSRLVDLHLIWRDLEGFTSGKCRGADQ